MPNFLSFCELPIPEICKICGEPIDPADKIISLFVLTSIDLPLIK